MSLSDTFITTETVTLLDERQVKFSRVTMKMLGEFAKRIEDRKRAEALKKFNDGAELRKQASSAIPQQMFWQMERQAREQATATVKVGFRDIMVDLVDDFDGIDSILRFCGEKAGSSAQDIDDALGQLGPMQQRELAVELLSAPVVKREAGSENPTQTGTTANPTGQNSPQASEPSTTSIPAT